MVAQLITVLAEPEPFGSLLARMRVQAGYSQNALARRAGVDPAYVNRMEKTAASDRPQIPLRPVVLALWEALSPSPIDRDRLLVAAGYCPQVILDAGGWDAYLNGAFKALDGFMSVLEGR